VKISVVIVNWNSKKYLNACLDSILEHSGDLDLEIIVIDSASFDGCGEMLHEHFPAVRFIQSRENLGFAKSNNLAAAAAVGEYLLFLNPDTEIRSGAIQALCSASERLPSCGIVGARLLNTDGTLQSSCVQAIPTILSKMFDSEFLRRRWPRAKVWGTAALYEEGIAEREVDAISGACMMLSSALFHRLGGFTEEYFMYAEDVDLSYKARIAGFANYYVPGATVVHHGGSSSGQMASTFSTVMSREATWRFFRKTRGRRYALAYRVGIMGSALVRIGLLAAAAPFRDPEERRLRHQSIRKWCATVRWSLDRGRAVRAFLQ